MSEPSQEIKEIQKDRRITITIFIIGVIITLCLWVIDFFLPNGIFSVFSNNSPPTQISPSQTHTQTVQESSFPSITSTSTQTNPTATLTVAITSTNTKTSSAFIIEDANNVIFDGCNYSEHIDNEGDVTGNKGKGIQQAGDWFYWDLTEFPKGILIGDAVDVEIDGYNLREELAANQYPDGISFYVTLNDESDFSELRLRQGAFYIVSPEDADGFFRLRERHLECLGTNNLPVFYPLYKVDSEVITNLILENPGGISDLLNWWVEVDHLDDDYNGSITPTQYSSFGNCGGLAWNTNEYGYHHLIVSQKDITVSFADGGWYSIICIPTRIQISLSDVGNFQATWLEKTYGDTSVPWVVTIIE